MVESNHGSFLQSIIIMPRMQGLLLCPHRCLRWPPTFAHSMMSPSCILQLAPTLSTLLSYSIPTGPNYFDHRDVCNVYGALFRPSCIPQRGPNSFHPVDPCNFYGADTLSTPVDSSTGPQLFPPWRSIQFIRGPNVAEPHGFSN